MGFFGAPWTSVFFFCKDTYSTQKQRKGERKEEGRTREVGRKEAKGKEWEKEKRKEGRVEKHHFVAEKKNQSVIFFSRLRGQHQERHIKLPGNRQGAASPSCPRRRALCAATWPALTTGTVLLPTTAIPGRCSNQERSLMGGKAVKGCSLGESPLCHSEKLLLRRSIDCHMFTRMTQCSRGSLGPRPTKGALPD